MGLAVIYYGGVKNGNLFYGSKMLGDLGSSKVQFGQQIHLEL